MRQIILGTRGSDLALKQTTTVTALIKAQFPLLEVEGKIIQTAGDKRPDLRLQDFHKGEEPLIDKGIFIKELETALADRTIHAAVHSLKDVPSDLERQFFLAAILTRAPVEDVLICREQHTLDTLPSGARVGTSSVRRARQLKWLRPDLEIVEVRGNVPTRIRKCLEPGGLDAIMLAAAGIQRLGFTSAGSTTLSIDNETLYTHTLDPRKFLPSAGQGAIAIEVMRGNSQIQEMLSPLNHELTAACVTAEREFLKMLGAGCQTPVGAFTWIEAQQLHMTVRVFSETNPIAPPKEATAHSTLGSPMTLARKLARAVM